MGYIRLWDEVERVTGKMPTNSMVRAVSNRAGHIGIKIVRQGKFKPAHFSSTDRDKVIAIIENEFGKCDPTIPNIRNVMDKVIINYLERNPNLSDRTLKARRDQILYLSKFFPGPVSEITEEQVRKFAKEKDKVVTTRTVAGDLTTLEDCFVAAGCDPGPVTVVHDEFRKGRRPSLRNVGRPDYVRGKGYNGAKQEKFQAPEPEFGTPDKETPELTEEFFSKATLRLPIKDNWIKATIIDSSHNRVEVEGDCVSSVLMESIIEIDRRVKQDPTQRTFILLLGER